MFDDFDGNVSPEEFYSEDHGDCCPDCGASDDADCDCGWDDDDADPGWADGDLETGLASAGYGTDEDYGGYEYEDDGWADYNDGEFW